MLSDVDLHLVVGWLYAAHEGREVPVVLGERVPDVTTGTRRDVDVVFAQTSDMGLAGVEVKGEKSPLDTPLVEQVCQKLADMPSLARRCLVSASGFTGPAVKKASAHGLECVRFVRGRLPSLGNVDLSHLRELPVTEKKWVDPHVTFLPHRVLSPETRERLAGDTPLHYATEGAPSRPRSLGELADLVTRNVTAQVLPKAEGLFLQPVAIDDAPTIEVDGQVIPVDEALFRATVQFETTVFGLDDCGFLESLDGVPLAAAVVIPLRTGLVGLYVSSEHQAVRFVHVPNVQREKRPFKLTLRPSSADPKPHEP